MPLSLSPATEADLPSLVTAQYAAFHPKDPIHMLFYPSPHPPTPSIISKTISRQAASMSDNTITWIKITDNSSPGNPKIIAGSKWIFYPPNDPQGERQDRWQENPIPSWTPESIQQAREEGISGKGAGDREYVAWVLGKLFEKRRERVQGPGVLLDLLFTHPEAQAKGAGKMMVQWGCKRADELGVKTWVEASYQGVRLYESCGFEKVEEVVVEGGKEKEEWKEYGVKGLWFMVRAARRNLLGNEVAV